MYFWINKEIKRCNLTCNIDYTGAVKRLAIFYICIGGVARVTSKIFKHTIINLSLTIKL